jgi:LAO/AO transport system kinase
MHIAGKTGRPSAALEQLFAALRGGETRALARAVSLVEDGAAEASALLALCREALAGRSRTGRSRAGRSRTGRTSTGKTRAARIGVTGPAGAGKSTLVDALTRVLRRQGRRVGIVAVDPSSPFSGGAILGDRIRLTDLAGDAGVYMRSMATRGHLGGLASATDDVLTVIETAFPEGGEQNVLLIETTGVGQGEIEIVGLADVVAVVLVPGMGDSVQSLKAGVLEIASVYVLNKADADGMERLESEIGEMLALSHVLASDKALPTVLKTVATTGQGVSELLVALDACFAGDAVPRPLKSQRQGSGDDARTALLSRGAVLDHLGIAVRSLEASQGLYAALGVPVTGIEEVAHERVRVAMLDVGDSRIELLEATAEDSAVGKFLAKRGEGLHHIALRVGDLEATVVDLKEQNVRLVNERIQIGAGGHRYVFVHPSSANGVLLELVESNEGGHAGALHG